MSADRPPHRPQQPPQLPGAVPTDPGPARPAPPARTPVAAALRHEPGEVPTIVASGRGALAEKILEIAFANGVKVREDADLAETLAALPLEMPIPDAAFEAVAEILRHIYAHNRRLAEGERP